MKPPPFTLVAPLAGADGYGHSAEQLWRHATHQGADVAFVPHAQYRPEFIDPELVDSIVEWYEGGQRELVVPYFLPFAFPRFRGSKMTIGMTMFETDSMPPFWVPMCNTTQGLIVTSEFCRRAFQKNVDVPVKVASLGVDTSVFTPGSTPMKGFGDFWFLMSGLLHYRKGADLALRAFREEFDRKEPVRLMLKTARGFRDFGDENPDDDERIWVIDEEYPVSHMVQMYRDADCYIACSRGEASGLTPREAMACGTPAIVVNWGGLEEIADAEYSYVIDIDDVVPAPPECSSYDANVAGRQPIGNFCVPSVTDLRAAMRYAYENRDENRRRGELAAQVILDRWSWGLCAWRWLRVLGEFWQGA